MKREEIREQAFICVYQGLILDQDIEDIIENQTEDIFLTIDQNKEIPLADDYFFRTITENVFNNIEFLIQTISKQLTDWQFDRLGYVEQAILLMGAAELYSEQTDRKVVINEAVNLAKVYADEDSYKMINAVLDNL